MSDYDWLTVQRLKKRLMSADSNALQESGLIDEDTIDYLISFDRAYEPGSREHYKTGEPAVLPQNTQEWRDIVKPVISKQISKAMRNGNMRILELVAGEDDDDRDVPFQEALTLEEQVHGDDFKIFVFTGGQGGGKSYFAYVLAKYKVRLCERDDIPVRAVTNSLSAVEMNEDLEFVGSPEELLDYRMENPGQIVFVFDEASSFLDSKAGGNAAQMAKFVKFLRRLRKMRIMPIIVSHRAMDIGPDIRKLDSSMFVHKPDDDTAVFYDDEQGGELKDKKFEISGYTTDERYDYESEDLFISWAWDGLDEIVELMENPQEFKKIWEEKGVVKDLREKAERIAKIEELEDDRADLVRACAELDYSQSEIAEFAGVSKSTVNSILGVQ
jgi:predicted transcriptional regulator